MTDKIDRITDESAVSWMRGMPGEQDTLVADVPDSQIMCPDGCPFFLEPQRIAVTDTGDVFWLMRCPLEGSYFEMEPVE